MEIGWVGDWVGWIGVGMVWDEMMLTWVGLRLGCCRSDIDGLDWYAVRMGRGGVAMGVSWAVDGLG